ncbi:phosphatidylglycerophosphatase A [Sulfurovum sp. bin170]|uniref:phosphatidylglycerophosphatase A family protein n=1 Tax=Sulfurovum sp. bin170 TaxID=2695268 RepID=UPI0013E0A717|nr:phosphatidylglycerophosphatase A [Sulfurovum sp. bin170]NEW60989.1 phosphatidylglycerophosphatase A [Sulfurovum sp. bin170]
MNLNRLFITFFGTGLAPKAPGTVGSLAALIVGVGILQFFPMDTLFMLTLAITIIGIFEINKYERETGSHDDKSIVIDEVAGMWIAMMFAISTAETMSYPFVWEIAIVSSFATFRLFDIWKPSTIGTIDRKVKGGLGVMGDDLLAGVAGGLLSALILMGLDKIL